MYACVSVHGNARIPYPSSVRAKTRMHIRNETLDDLLKEVYGAILEQGAATAGYRGRIKEITGVLLEITNPRNRLSLTETKGKIFSAIGELLWYLAGTASLDFIVYYVPDYVKESEDKKTVYGAYGPRIFYPEGSSQMDNVYALLRDTPLSKRAVVQIFSRDDIKKRLLEIPCTCTLQFLVRKNRVDLIVNMRSNDAFLGLPHDVFAFTMIQEIVARVLGYDIGTYKHMVGSLHLYEKHFGDAEIYQSEGYQPTTQAMPSMPLGDPRPAIKTILAAETCIRRGEPLQPSTEALEPYWLNIVRLLQIFSANKHRNSDDVARIHSLMSTTYYDAFIQRAQPKLKTSEKR